METYRFLPTAELGQPGMEYVESDDRLKLAGRVAGVRRTRIPLVMLHGLQSHSGWFGKGVSSQYCIQIRQYWELTPSPVHRGADSLVAGLVPL